jgi:F-type H+-transporting ATPase subunit b
MNIPGPCGKHKHRSKWAMVGIVAVIFLMGLAPAYGSGGEGGHAVQSKPWVKTDTAKVLNFSVLAIFLFLVLRKPVAKALSDRVKGISDELEELEARKSDVEKQLALYNTKLATLDKESEALVAEYIRQGEEARARILKEAELAADRLEEQAQKNIAREFGQAKQALQKEIVDKALAKAELAIKAQVTDKDQERLVDEYLNKVVA